MIVNSTEVRERDIYLYLDKIPYNLLYKENQKV